MGALRLGEKDESTKSLQHRILFWKARLRRKKSRSLDRSSKDPSSRSLSIKPASEYKHLMGAVEDILTVLFLLFVASVLTECIGPSSTPMSTTVLALLIYEITRVFTC